MEKEKCLKRYIEDDLEFQSGEKTSNEDQSKNQIKALCRY